tara:strand:- start:2 stop:217 length:216 start_codon:yes stop_codon:yes gene_type:complete
LGLEIDKSVGAVAGKCISAPTMPKTPKTIKDPEYPAPRSNNLAVTKGAINIRRDIGTIIIPLIVAYELCPK